MNELERELFEALRELCGAETKQEAVDMMHFSGAAAKLNVEGAAPAVKALAVLIKHWPSPKENPASHPHARAGKRFPY